jgi:hypothetical protein
MYVSAAVWWLPFGLILSASAFAGTASQAIKRIG